MFAAYVSPVGDLAETFGISYHQFADDTQIYVDLSDIGAASTMSQLAACTAAVCHWFLLNTSKSEAMTLGTAVEFQSVESAVRTVDTVGTSFPLINELKTLGIILESHVRSAKHATAGTKTWYYHHLRALRHFRNALSDDVAEPISCSIVRAKLDYCKSPVSTWDKLQHVQNQLARIVTKSDWRADTTPAL